MRKFYYMLILSLLSMIGETCFAQVGTLPYRNDFDSYDPAVTTLPEGWTTEGKAQIKIGAYNTGWCLPYTDPYYIMFSDNTDYPRQDWVFTQGFNMEAGKRYFANFYIYAPGYTITTDLSESFRVTAGMQQTSEAQTYVLFESKGIKYKDWTRIQGSFVPEQSGIYYLAINIFTPIESNGIGVDNLEIYSEDDPFPVVARYKAKGGYWSVITDNMKKGLRYIYPDQPITFVNESEYASSYSWQTFGEPSTSEEISPVVYYKESGLYEPVLTASNKGGTETYKDEVNVIVLGEEEFTDKISNHDKYDGDSYYRPFEVDEYYYEYVTGINRYYNTVAEKFDMPDDARFSINSLSLMLYNYKVATKDRGRTVDIRVYGDAWGVPDPNNIFGTYTTTMEGAFGSLSVVDDQKNVTIKFDKPIEVKGTFYVSIEIDELVEYSSATHLGFLSFKSWTGETKAFVNIAAKDVTPTPALGLSPGWYPVNELPYPLDGYDKLSFFLSPEITFHKIDNTSVGNEIREELSVYPTVFDDFISIRMPDSPIDKVAIYNLNGQKVYESLNVTSEQISTSAWSSGVYMVNIESNSIKRTIKVVKL